MKLTIPQDWTFATGINPEKGRYKCQGKKLEVSPTKMFHDLYAVKVPPGTYNVELTNHDGEVWLVLVGAGTRRRKNIAIGVILSILMKYKSSGVSLVTDDGSPVNEAPNDWDEANFIWSNGKKELKQEKPIVPIADKSVKVHAWFSKKHAAQTAPALYLSEHGEPLLVTSCSLDYEESKPSKVNSAYDDGVYRGLVVKYLATERDYKSHTDYQWNLK